MKHLFFCSFLGFILLFVASSYFEKEFVPGKEVNTNSSQIFNNPLDQILGEKKLDDGSIRKDNFDSILKIPSKFLLDSSELYSIKRLNNNLYLLKRKKFFLNNRYYSLVVKTKSSHISAVFPFVDHAIVDGLIEKDTLYLLCGDYSEQSYPWKQDYMIQIIGYDNNLNEFWMLKTCKDKGYFFCGTGLSSENNHLLVSFDVQGVGSSTMCKTNYTVSFSKKGKFDKLIGFGGYSCGPGEMINQDEIKTFFTN